MLTNNTIEELTEGVLRHGPDILSHCVSNSDDLKKYVQRINNEFLNYPIPQTDIDTTRWFVPNDYCPNLTEMLYGLCKTEEEKNRVSQELELYIKHGMYDVLHAVKYIVDILRKNHIVWGVGRGSSVASYVLFLIGVHKIDSIKYNIPIEEFFKGDQNG